MNNSLYCLEQVKKDYGSRRVLEIDQLSIHAGEIFALVGPSGSGKSSLLRLLNFLEAPTHGEITFHGTAFNSGKEMSLHLRRLVTMVFQRPMLLNRSVAGNVRFGLELRNQRKSDALVETALKEVGLSALADHNANRLSGGEAQRVALARAMVLQPEVLLLDEPTANLDPYNVGLIEKIIRDMNVIHGATLVLVTHNVFQARRLADRVAFLMDGKLIEVAPADTFFNQPTDPRTAAFVRGDMIY
jgi:tungstate transport system ATP-binding protein